MRLRQSELTRAVGELEHVKESMRRGILTFTTKAMLEEAEHCVAECDAALAAAREAPAKIERPSPSINRYLEDPRGALHTDNDRARRLLTKMLGKVTLRREGTRLLAEVKGDLLGLLDVDEEVFGRAAAGRGISYPPHWHLENGRTGHLKQRHHRARLRGKPPSPAERR